MTEEKVDPNYTKGFNLGYWLNKNSDGEKHFADLLDLQKSPKFRETTMYQGLSAGRDAALKERGIEKGHPVLTGDQKKELAEYQQWESDSKKKQDFKETTRKMNIEAAENSDFVERSIEESEEERKRKFKEQFINKGKGKDNDRDR